MPRNQKLKLTAVQQHRVNTSLHDLADLLREIKQKTLSGDALAAMKNLEGAVQHLECFQLQARR